VVKGLTQKENRAGSPGLFGASVEMRLHRSAAQAGGEGASDPIVSQTGFPKSTGSNQRENRIAREGCIACANLFPTFPADLSLEGSRSNDKKTMSLAGG